MMGGATRILFVDDEKRLRDTSQRVLTGLGYEVTTAENGRAALDVLSKTPIDIILLDLKMPVMGGEEALEFIHEKYPRVPVIMITAHPDLDTAVTCMKKGACDFLAKPFEVDQLLLCIDLALDKRRPKRRADLTKHREKNKIAEGG